MDLQELNARFGQEAARSVSQWTGAINTWASEKGWWPFARGDRLAKLIMLGDRSATVERNDYDPFYYLVAEKLALIGTEVSEAIEEWRREKPLLYELETTGDRGLMELTPKPEGILVELADAAIRIFDLAHALAPGVDFGAVIAWKMAYNQKRPHRHGGLRG